MNNEIKCPNCGKIFKIDEGEYDSIVKQIRDKEFDKEITLRDKQHELDKENSLKLKEAELEKDYNEKISKKNLEITELKNKLDNSNLEITSKLDKDYSTKLSKKEKELSDRDKEITDLKNKIQLMEKEEELNLHKAINDKEKEIDNLNNKIEINKNEYLLKEQSLKESYEEKIKNKDEVIAYYKDFKAKQSTKMIGESLEVHCNNEFNRIRPILKNAYFVTCTDYIKDETGKVVEIHCTRLPVYAINNQQPSWSGIVPFVLQLNVERDIAPCPNSIGPSLFEYVVRSAVFMTQLSNEIIQLI